MKNILTITTIVVSILLIISIALQSKDSGFGSSSLSFMRHSYHTRRGLEKMVFVLTIILVVAFAITAILLLFL